MKNETRKNLLSLGWGLAIWFFSSLIYFIINRCFIHNDEITMDGFAIFGLGVLIIFCVVCGLIEQFIKTESKVKYLIFVVCYIAIWFLINWHRLH